MTVQLPAELAGRPIARQEAVDVAALFPQESERFSPASTPDDGSILAPWSRFEEGRKRAQHEEGCKTPTRVVHLSGNPNGMEYSTLNAQANGQNSSHAESR